jgi:excinuclease ABC subunit A
VSGLDQLDKVIDIDQRPIGRTPRSNPVTYIKVFDEIRSLFAGLPEARVHGYAPGRFSFNVKGGRCEACEGDGVRQIEMHFLADVFVRCEQCQGRRFNEATLRVRYKGRSIAEVLDLTVREGIELFAAQPRIAGPLALLAQVGLDYLHLGQPSPTLSGGEAQRIKLARELSRRATGRTLYILDEPTTGLHFEDVRRLLTVLEKLVGAGNTVVVIEHNLDVIKTADWILDLGPEGGPQGGRIVAQGTPEQVAGVRESHTGQQLAALFTRQRGRVTRQRGRAPRRRR